MTINIVVLNSSSLCIKSFTIPKKEIRSRNSNKDRQFNDLKKKDKTANSFL
jgi:hypothetical protein